MGRRRQRELEKVGVVLGRERSFRNLMIETPPPISAPDWEAAVGTRIAARAKPTRLDRGVLLVTTATSAWSNELSLLAEPILDKLRRAGIDVRELRFRVGPMEPPPPPARRPAKIVARPVPLEAPLARSLERVEDDELRAAIERAARTALGYTKRD